MVIVALDFVPHCYTYSDGLVIAGEIARVLRDGNKVTLSFHGVNNVPSSFVNGAFVSLLDTFSVSTIKAMVRIVDSTRQINDLIRDRVEAKGSEELLCA